MDSMVALRPQWHSRKAIFKGRLWRSLLVVLLSTLFLFVFLYYADDSTTIPFKPSVLPHDGMQDVFVRSTGPRVVILTMSNKIDDALCYSVGSAYLSGLPVVVAGYQMPYRDLTSKFEFLESAIKNARLRPEDVVIVLDSDTFFTGVDINPFLDRFITQSAATPEELDALAVRQGRAMAPVVANGEIGCWAPNTLGVNWGDCMATYAFIYNKVTLFATQYPKHKLAVPFNLVPQNRLNSGAVIARAWAYKEILQKAVNLTKTQASPYYPDKGWNCDQSIFTALYLNLLTWEVEQDVFSMPLAERQAARSPYGMRAGFIGLDYANMLASMGSRDSLHQYELHDEHWTKYLSPEGGERSHSHDINDFVSMSRFAVDLYKRAYAAQGRKIYTKLAVPRWIGGKRASGEANLALTPPLLAVKARPMDTVNNKVHRTFPIIFHTANLGPGYTKVSQMEAVSFGARWLMPMVFEERAKHQAMEYLASAPLFLSTNNSIIRDSYHAKCGFPFARAIRKSKLR